MGEYYTGNRYVDDAVMYRLTAVGALSDVPYWVKPCTRLVKPR